MDSLVHNWQEKTANTVRHDVQHLKVPAWNSKDVRHGAVELRIHRHSGAQLCTSSSSHFQSTGFSNMHSRTHVRTVASQCKLCNLSSVRWPRREIVPSGNLIRHVARTGINQFWGP